ncbi:hypothetical protein Tco_0915762 [Tanacetum coccineum]
MTARTKKGLGFHNLVGDDDWGFGNSEFSVFTTDLEDIGANPIYNWFDKVDHMKAVPPPMTGNYMPTSNASDDNEIVFRTISKNFSSFDSSHDSLSETSFYGESVYSPSAYWTWTDPGFATHMRSHSNRKSSSNYWLTPKRMIKQTIVATSSCEAEYVAAASCCGQFTEDTTSVTKGLATPELMATGKETSNPFTVLGGSKLVAVKTLLGLSLVADLIHCYMFTLLLIHSFKTQQGQAGWLLAVAVAVKSSLLNFCGAFI